MEVCAINKLLSLFILISLLLNNKILIESYSQVSRVGSIVSSTNNSSNNNDSNNNSTNSEIIKHNPGREGVFSTSDNDDNNKTMSESNDDELTTNENKSTEVFTGRSSPSMGGFQFPINFNTQPISYRRPAMAKSNYNPNEKSSTSNSPIFVYPSYGSKNIDQTYKYSSNLPPPSTAMDRFSPGEAYGFQQYQKNKKNNGYNYAPPKSQLKETPASQPAKPSPPPVIRPVLPTAPVSVSPVYIPPKDLYAFPPNIGANYLPPNMKTNQRPVTSYLPPAAGSDDFDPNSFVGPVNPKYLPSSNLQDTPQSMMSSDSASMEMNSPPSDDHNHDHDHDHDHSHDHNHDHDHPPSGPPSGEGIDYHDHHHHHDHDHNHDLPSDVMSDSPPPPSPNVPTTENPLTQMMSMVVEALKNNNKSPAPPPSPPSVPSPPTGSDITFSSPDHSHFHYPDHDFHHDDHDFHGQYGVDAFPEVVYDHDPHDHHHDIVITTTEPPPPPEEHMESRVKKYSYYYLGRKLWYIPLYFTVYFSFYVAALIIRSIGRHKVEWPNHYQKRSIADNMSHKETVRKVEKLTNFVMNSIEDFKEKYF